jgi:CheY-like chemotaxis protein
MQPLKTSFSRGALPHAKAAHLETHILIIDNDRRVGVTLSFMLASRGYNEIRAVRSAARSLAITEKFQPEIVFLDLELPEAESLRLAKRLRQESRARPLRLIALTGDAEHPLREEARLAGFERFLTKPVAQEELDKVLGKA